MAAARKLINEFFKNYNASASLGRQHRLPDGRLVPQGDQDRRRPQGSEDAHRRLRRARPAEARRRAAADRRAATSIRRWKRAPSTPPNGSAPMTTRSSASTRLRRTITIPAGGKAARCCLHRQPREVERAAEALPGDPVSRRRPRPTPGALAKYDQVNPRGAAAPAGRRHQAAWLLAGDHGGLLQGRHGLHDEIAKENAKLQEGVRTLMNTFTKDGYAWSQVAELGYRLASWFATTAKRQT